MTTIGYATLQIIPSLLGVTEAIDKQIDGKVVNVSIAPKVDQRAADTAGKQVKETVEKQTTEVKVTPKADTKAAEAAGKQTKEAVEKQTSDVRVTPKIENTALTNAGAQAGELAGRAIGEQIAKTIPQGMGGIAGSVGNVLRAALPGLGSVVGAGTGAALVTSILNAVTNGRYDKAGDALKRGLVGAVNKANVGSEIAVSLGNSIGNGLGNVSTRFQGFADSLSAKVSDVSGALSSTKELLGGDGAFGSGVIDDLNTSLEATAPLLLAINSGATLAAAGQAIMSGATKAITAAQWLWNAALTANPIGVIVVAIAALAAGIIYAYNHSETFRKIVDAAWKAIKIAAEAVVTWFVDTAWPFLKKVWEGIGDGWNWLVTKAGEVWTGVRDKFTAIVDFVRGLPAAITSAARGMWDGLKHGLAEVVNWIADKLNVMIDGANTVASAATLGSAPKIPHVPKIEGFDLGGYTGNMPISRIAGVVHGDEFVIQSKSRRTIENLYPGLLDFLNNQGKLPGYEGGGLVKGTSELRNIISQRFGITNIGGWRPQDKYGEHSTGRALDVMTSDKAKGDAVKDFAVDNASAIDLKWAIWQQKLWYPGGRSEAMADRGSPTQNHMDHVHIFSGPGITNGLLGALKSTTAEPAQTPGGGVNPPVGDAGGAVSGDATPVSSGTGSGGGISLPSSLSGLSGYGLDGLGKGIGATSSGKDLSVFGQAAGSAVTGQVSSALGVLGINDSPGWLKGISTFVGGLSISDSSGKKIFGGGGGASAFSGAGNLFGGSAQDGYGGAAPISASAPVPTDAAGTTGDVHGARAGQQPGPQVIYNIAARDTEDAFIRAQRQERERTASKLERFGG